MVLRRFGKNLKEACRHITLHGFINIAQSSSKAEMVFWIIVDCLCFALCLWLMAIHWVRYQSRPTVTTIKSTAYPISDIPFPAVTVCNSNLVYKKNIDVYVDILKNEGVNETFIQQYFEHLNYQIYLDTEDMNENLAEFLEIEQILNDQDITIEKMMRNLAHPCNEMIQICTWSSVKRNCSDLFRTIKTRLGFCCSFNYHNGLVDTTEQLTQLFKEPAVAHGAGTTHGLGMLVILEPDQYMSPVFPFYAAFVLVHPNWDYPDMSAFSIALQSGDFSLMQLSPTVYTSEPVLKTVAVNRRNCWFGHEGDLQTSHDYSFPNCIIECKAKTIYSLCKCLPFYYPSLGDREQCSLKHIPCLKKYEKVYDSITLSDNSAGNNTGCNCLPECEDVLYDGYLNAVRESIKRDGIAYVQVYYDHSWCVEYNQSLNLTWDILLASLGGIFGLCLGGSLISLVEIVFYIMKSIILTILQSKQVAPKKSEFNKKKIVNHTRITTVAHY